MVGVLSGTRITLSPSPLHISVRQEVGPMKNLKVFPPTPSKSLPLARAPLPKVP